MMDSTVAKRLVFHISGYDHERPEAAHGRFARELRRFEGVWAVSAVPSKPATSEDFAAWQVVTAGPNWRVETDFRLVRWDDVIEDAITRPMWRRIPEGMLAFLDFILAGAFWGYCRANWRYAGFFLYPILIVALIAMLSLAGGAAITRMTASGMVGTAAGIGSFFLLFHAGERWLYLGLLFDDWIFAHQYIRRGDPVLERRLLRVAGEIVEAARRNVADEILVVGHSLGAVLAIDLIDRAISLGGGVPGARPRITLLSVGSSTLKIGLHHAASGFRAAVARVSSCSDVFWVDYQARADVMNFHRTDPLPLMGLAATGSPVIRSVSIRRMIDPARYPRLRKNLYRVHCQFVRGNDRRASYDYFMFTCGPLRATRQAGAKEGAMHAFDADGRFLDSSPSAAANKNAVEVGNQ